MSFGQMLTGTVQNWTQLETATGALSRIKSFTETVASENMDEETEKPSKEWLSSGSIEINGVSASYE